jgi:hypothetical protein
MGTDLSGDPDVGDPGLDHLFGALTSAPMPDELGGEGAALAMFRASRRPARRRMARWTAPRTVAAAVALALAGGFAAAAYTAALPSPVQHAAYHVLGIIGVPDHPVPAGAHPRSAPPTLSTGDGSPSPLLSPSRSAGRGRSAGATKLVGRLSLTAASGRIPAGRADAFAALAISSGGRAIRGVSLTLQQRPAGQATWRRAGRATTGPRGGAELRVRDLTRNAWFRLTGPGGAVSRPVLVTVVPAVAVALASGPTARTDLLTVSCRFGDAGDAVVLQLRILGEWRSLRLGLLDGQHEVVFTVRVPRTVAWIYRVVLPATVAHGRAVSSRVTVPPQSA